MAIREAPDYAPHPAMEWSQRRSYISVGSLELGRYTQNALAGLSRLPLAYIHVIAKNSTPKALISPLRFFPKLFVPVRLPSNASFPRESRELEVYLPPRHSTE